MIPENRASASRASGRKSAFAVANCTPAISATIPRSVCRVGNARLSRAVRSARAWRCASEAASREASSVASAFCRPASCDASSTAIRALSSASRRAVAAASSRFFVSSAASAAASAVCRPRIAWRRACCSGVLYLPAVSNGPRSGAEPLNGSPAYVLAIGFYLRDHEPWLSVQTRFHALH